MSPDGKQLIFSSDRTDDLKGTPNPADDFFRVTQSSGWTDVTRLTNTEKMSEKRGSLANDGSFYYWAYQRGSGMYFFELRLTIIKLKIKKTPEKCCSQTIQEKITRM